jgi:catechol 2,3-dioxygenase-like lactoylglutathione lyase family enzyme
MIIRKITGDMAQISQNIRSMEFTHAPTGECGLEMIGNSEVCADVEAMVEWYQRVMDLRILKRYENNEDVVVYLTDKDYDPQTRNTVFILQTACLDFEKSHMAEHGPYISAVVYQAKNVQRAFEDALWAGMKELQAPEVDPLTGALTAYLREPCGGNILMLREQFKPE